MPIQPSTARHVLSLALPYLTHSSPALQPLVSPFRRCRHLFAYSKKSRAKGHVDRLIGWPRYPLSAAGTRSIDARERDLRVQRRKERASRSKQDSLSSSEHSRASHLRDYGDAFRDTLRHRVHAHLEEERKPNRDPIDPYEDPDFRALLGRIEARLRRLDHDYLTTASTQALLVDLEELRVDGIGVRPTQLWRDCSWSHHRALRIVWAAIARVLVELDRRGQAEGLMRGEEFLDILESLMIYRPTRQHWRGRRRVRAGENSRPGSSRQNVNQDESITDADGNLNHFAPLTVPYIFRLIGITGNQPTPKQLVKLAKSASLRLLPSVPHAQTRRTWAAMTHQDLARSVEEIWTRRRDLIESICGIWPEFENERIYETEIMQGLDECDILLHGRLLGLPQLRLERMNHHVMYWRTKRAALVARKRETVRMVLAEWSDGPAPNSTDEDHPDKLRAAWRKTRTMAGDLLWLIRDSLLAPELHTWSLTGGEGPQSTAAPLGAPGTETAVSAGGHDLTDPFDLFDILVRVLFRPDSGHKGDGPSAFAILHLSSCIIRMRNTFYLSGRIDRLVSLVNVLGIEQTARKTNRISRFGESGIRSPLPVIPPLPSKVHETLLCAGTSPTTLSQFRQLLVALSHLPRPSEPLAMGSYTRSNLNYIALQADRDDRIAREDTTRPNNHLNEFVNGAADDHIRIIRRMEGWRGVLLHLYEKWGEGLTEREWEMREKVERAYMGQGQASDEEKRKVRQVRHRANLDIHMKDKLVMTSGEDRNILVKRKKRTFY